MSEWITEKVPPEQEDVIVTIRDDSGDTVFNYTSVGWYYNGYWVVDNEINFKVVAWQPLPQPYTKWE